jgi:hypothetical protein
LGGLGATECAKIAWDGYCASMGDWQREETERVGEWRQKMKIKSKRGIIENST